MSQIGNGVNATDIAVIGMSGRFPGARNVDQYWRNLYNQVESVTFLTKDELIASGLASDVVNDVDYVRAAYLLDDADRFDANFFSYSPREARFIDPQQRVLLECALEAMEHAGYAGEAKPQTGVYVGSSLNTYLLFTGLAEQFQTDPVLTLMSNDKDFLATRIGYKLQLEGPCVTVQTACSTSLVAVHMACQSILAGECDMALAGGVCVKVPLKAGYLYREGGMLSLDGHCRAFDASATGTIFGSGAGLVVLKRYADAVRDRDTIHAVIKGTAINNDGGRKASYTAPSVDGLADVIGQAMDFGQIKADDISYVECHGTGTALGDPIEVHALTKAFRSSTTREHFSALASVKTNVGHLESASGIAGLIKAICCMKNRYLPSSLHFRSPNPALGLQGSPFFVNGEGRVWSPENGKRIAAVNSLGVGGTNANVLLGEAPAASTLPSRRSWHLLPISSKSDVVTEQMKGDVLSHLEHEGSGSAADVAFTLQVGRRQFASRDVVLLSDAGIRKSLTTRSQPARASNVVLLCGNDFPAELASQLGQHEPAFVERVRQVEDLFKADQAGVLPEDLKKRKVFSYEVALAGLWASWGIAPVAVFGQGSGIAAAAYIARHSASGREMPSGHDVYYAPCFESGSAWTADLEEACRRVLDLHPQTVFLPVSLESGLSSVLGSMLQNSKTQQVLQPLDLSIDHESPCLLRQAAGLWKAGAPLDFAAMYEGEERSRVPVPGTPLRGERHWWTGKVRAEAKRPFCPVLPEPELQIGGSTLFRQ